MNITLSKEKISVLIPAAGEVVASSSFNKSGYGDGFLNVGTTLAVERIYSLLGQSKKYQVYLGVIEKNNKIYDLIPYENICVVEVGNTSTVAETIGKMIDHVQTEWCLINPITTIPSIYETLLATAFIYFDNKKIPKENWSALNYNQNNEAEFYSKNDSTFHSVASYAFTGKIYAKTSILKDALLQLNIDESFDLINVAKFLHSNNFATICHEKWIDIGHDATYPESKLYSISSRHFNEVTYDKKRNTIIKRSRDKRKIRSEGEFFEKCPSVQKRYFPAVINSLNESDYWRLELEYIGLPSLAEIFLYSQNAPNMWCLILKSLKRTFNDFYSKDSNRVENLSWLYSDKTNSRQIELESLLHSTDFEGLKAIYYDDFSVNGHLFPSLKKSFAKINSFLINYEQSRTLYFGHGDLCFNNILVDPIFGSLKLIDPKVATHPETGEIGLIDPAYDLAKLYHSFAGLYDSIVNNLYCISVGGSKTISLTIFKPNNYEYILDSYIDLFIENDQRLCEYQLLTANLFFSMLPLHKEDPKRICTLAIVGSFLLYDSILPSLIIQK